MDSFESKQVRRADVPESSLVSVRKAAMGRGRCWGSYVHPEPLSSSIHDVQGRLASHF